MEVKLKSYNKPLSELLLEALPSSLQIYIYNNRYYLEDNESIKYYLENNGCVLNSGLPPMWKYHAYFIKKCYCNNVNGLVIVAFEETMIKKLMSVIDGRTVITVMVCKKENQMKTSYILNRIKKKIEIHYPDYEENQQYEISLVLSHPDLNVLKTLIHRFVNLSNNHWGYSIIGDSLFYNEYALDRLLSHSELNKYKLARETLTIKKDTLLKLLELPECIETNLYEQNINAKASNEGIKIGELNNQDYRISFSRLQTHTFISGASGYGKSNFIKSLLIQLNKEHIPFCYFEPVKNDSLTLSLDNVTRYACSEDHEYIPFKMNPLIPLPKQHLEDHKAILKTLMTKHLYLDYPLNVIVENTIDAIYSLNGYYGYNNGNIFDAGDFINLYKRLAISGTYSKELTGNIREAGTNRLKDFFDGCSSIFNTCESIELDLNQSMIINLDDLENQEKKELVISITLDRLVYILKHRKVNSPYMIIIDECHNIVYPGSVYSSKIKQILEEIRSYNTGIVLADQTLSDHETLLPLFQNKVIYNNDLQELEYIKNELNLNQQFWDNKYMLHPGEYLYMNRNLKEPVLLNTKFIPEQRVNYSKNAYLKSHPLMTKPYKECRYCTHEQCQYFIKEQVTQLANSMITRLRLVNGKLTKELVIKYIKQEISSKSINKSLVLCLFINMIYRCKIDLNVSIEMEDLLV